MKILVTGATGFLGRRLCELLIQSDYSVVATGRNLQTGRELEKQGLHFIPGDLSNPEFANQVVFGCDAIIHCAALSTIWANYEQFYQANVLAVKHLIAAAQKQQISRIVHISTPSVYVGAAVKEDIRENIKLPEQFANDYIHTKRMSENLLLQAASEGAFQAVILRPQGIFGPQDSSIIPRLLAANERRGIPLIRGGQHLIDATYVDNVCQAIGLSLHSKQSEQTRIYNITNGEPVIFLELLQKIFTSIHLRLRCKPQSYKLLNFIANMYEKSYKWLGINHEPPLTRYTLSILSESRTLNIEAAREQLGYKPHISLDEGIARYAQWYNQQRLQGK